MKILFVHAVIIASVLFGSSFVFQSCNNKKDVKQKQAVFLPRENKMSTLAGSKKKEWKIEKYYINGENKLEKLEDCEKDNLDVYFTDHRFESIEGKKKCKPSDPYLTDTGYWYFNEDTTEIEVTIGYDFYILKLIELSSDKFHYISISDSDTIEAILTPHVI